MDMIYSNISTGPSMMICPGWRWPSTGLIPILVDYDVITEKTSILLCGSIIGFIPLLT